MGSPAQGAPIGAHSGLAEPQLRHWLALEIKPEQNLFLGCRIEWMDLEDRIFLQVGCVLQKETGDNVYSPFLPGKARVRSSGIIRFIDLPK